MSPIRHFSFSRPHVSMPVVGACNSRRKSRKIALDSRDREPYASSFFRHGLFVLRYFLRDRSTYKHVAV
jgi:hypothetical protein